jgi:parvulin-like peptidyl-prolyl isomerase
MRRYLPNLYGLLYLLLVMLILVACGTRTTTPTEVNPTGIPTSTLTPTATATPFPPSPSPVPLAAIVNGEEITVAEFESELARYKAAQRETVKPLVEGYQAFVLDDMINQILLSQGAQQMGFIADESLIEERYDQIVKESGGEEAVLGWLAANGYTVDSFHQALARSITSAWMRDQILDSVPKAVEQVHARQILLNNFEEAQEVLTQLESGNDFATLAATFDPVLSGDLGWVPRGYLEYVQLEQVIFALQPLEYSEIVETPLGFHILQLIERDPNRELDPEAGLIMHRNEIQAWLEERRKESDIVISLQGLRFEP